MILSVSRRTDVPAFYSDWFFDRLQQGFVLVPNPINHAKIAKVKLEPLQIVSVQQTLLGDKVVQTQGTLEGIVFWTKNPAPMLPRLDEIPVPYYFLYTLNAYPAHIEGGLPTLLKRVESFKQLAAHCPVIWRYDPILLADGIDVEWHIAQFEKLCAALDGFTQHCKVSFVIESYGGCSKSVHAPTLPQKKQILSAFAQIAKVHGIQIEACAENDWSEFGIVPSKCIDGEIFEQLIAEKYADLGVTARRKNNKLDGQRKGCLCMPSVDVGQYDTCRHGCNYCYARKSTPHSLTDEPHGEIYDRKLELEFEYR